MVVIAYRVIRDFIKVNPVAKSALSRWYSLVTDADWNDLADLKETFPATDFVGNDRYVFNISGNKFRLVAMIFFSTRTVFIKFIGSHNDYNKIDATHINLF